MAIYHFAMQIGSRSDGKSSVAMASYRSDEKLTDERTGEVKKFRPHLVEPETAIMAPKHAPEWVYNRERLWNEVEKIEKQKNSQLCREFNIALPIELTKEQQQLLIAKFVQEQFVDLGMVADIAIHRDDPGNPHFHVMLTMRPFNEDGTWGSKSKKAYVLDEQGEKIKLKSGNYKTYKERTTNWDEPETLKKWREEWANHTNRALERAGVPARIDHRSLEGQGITDRLPTIHEGVIVNKMELKGKTTDRGDLNRAVHEHNAIVVSLENFRKEKQQNELLRPEDRKSMRQAKQILGKTVNLVSVHEGLEDLHVREQGLQKQLDQMLKQQQMFNDAGNLLQKIKSLNIELERPRLMNREGKLQYEKAVKQLAEARAALNKLGFNQDEKQFIARKEKVNAYHDQEKAQIEGVKKQIAGETKILQNTEKILQLQEVQILAQQYPDAPGINKLSYSEAKAIQEFNQSMGRKVHIPEILEVHDKRAAELQKLTQQKEQVMKNAERLRIGEQWLTKYEKQYAESRKLFKSTKVKQQLKGDMETSKRMLKEYGVIDRRDLNNQISMHRSVEDSVPEINHQVSMLQPGMSLIQGAVKALRSAEQRQSNDQQMQQWAKKRKGIINTYSNDKDLER